MSMLTTHPFADDDKLHEECGVFGVFGHPDAAALMMELKECRKVYGDRYIRLVAFDSSHGWESVRLSFIVNRPETEPGFRLDRQEAAGRGIRYTTRSYAADKPAGARYG